MRSAIQKLYHSITEVSQMIGEEQHVLRYWEREFPLLRPQKNRAGNRVYTQRDLAILRVIKRLLRQERYTVAGAREYLRQHQVGDEIDLHDPDDGAAQDAAPGGADAGTYAGVAESTAAAEAVGPAPDEVRQVVDELRDIAATLRSGLSS